MGQIQSAPERSSPSPTHLWVSEESSGPWDGMLAVPDSRDAHLPAGTRWLSAPGEGARSPYGHNRSASTQLNYIKSTPDAAISPPFLAFETRASRSDLETDSAVSNAKQG